MICSPVCLFYNFHFYLNFRKYFSIDEILKKYYDKDGPRDMARCRQKVEKSLNCFAKVTEPDKDFMTEIELLSNFKVEIFHLNKVCIIFYF